MAGVYHNYTPPLFAKRDLWNRLDADHRDALSAADSVPLGKGNIDALAANITEAHVLLDIVLDLKGQFLRPRHHIIENSKGGGFTELLEVHTPFEAHPAIFDCRPTRPPGTSFHGVVTSERTIVFDLLGAQDPLEAKRSTEQRTKTLMAWVAALNVDIRQSRAVVYDQVHERLRRRVQSQTQVDALAASLNIAVRKVAASEAVNIPAERRRVSITSTERAVDEPEQWTLAQQTYDEIIGVLTRFGHALERRPPSATQLVPDEETLRDWMLFVLNATYQRDDGTDLFIAGETVNGAGKTDILVRQGDRNALIAECKFWDGEATVAKAAAQLFGYLTWRDVKAALVLLVKNKTNPTALIAKAVEMLRTHPQYVSDDATAATSARHDFIMSHPGDPDIRLALALVPVVLTSSASQQF